MNKKNIYNMLVNNYVPYQGIIYLACCIGVEYDYDIVNHFISHYKNLGVDEFLFVLNTNIDNSQKLLQVQNILREHDIEEKIIWKEAYHHVIHTQILMDMIESNIGDNEWVLTADVDEFHEYFCDLRKFISYLEENNYEYAAGVQVDRLSVDGKIINISEDDDLFELFPLKTRLTEDIVLKKDPVLNIKKSYLDIMIHRSYIKLSSGHHGHIQNNKYKYRCFPSILDVNHFKWRGDFIIKQKYMINNLKRLNNKSDDITIMHHEKPLDYFIENGSFIAVSEKTPHACRGG